MKRFKLSLLFLFLSDLINLSLDLDSIILNLKNKFNHIV